MENDVEMTDAPAPSAYPLTLESVALWANPIITEGITAVTRLSDDPQAGSFSLVCASSTGRVAQVFVDPTVDKRFSSPYSVELFEDDYPVAAITHAVLEDLTLLCFAGYGNMIRIFLRARRMGAEFHKILDIPHKKPILSLLLKTENFRNSPNSLEWNLKLYIAGVEHSIREFAIGLQMGLEGKLDCKVSPAVDFKSSDDNAPIEIIASCSDDGSTRLWSRAARSDLVTLGPHDDDVHTFAHFENTMFTAGKDRIVKIFTKTEMRKGKAERHEWPLTNTLALTSMIRHLLAPSREYLICATAGGEIVIWKFQERAYVKVCDMKAHNAPISHLEMMTVNHEDFLFSADEDGHVSIWRIRPSS